MCRICAINVIEWLQNESSLLAENIVSVITVDGDMESLLEKANVESSGHSSLSSSQESAGDSPKATCSGKSVVCSLLTVGSSLQLLCTLHP